MNFCEVLSLTETEYENQAKKWKTIPTVKHQSSENEAINI